MTNFEVIVKEHPQYVKKVLAHNLTRSNLELVVEGSKSNYDWYNSSNDKAEMDFLNAEYVQPVLDDIEKKYLSNIIAPFKHNIKNIRKAVCSGRYFIEINMKEACDRVCLPYFEKRSKMYNGMVPSKPYTLDELGL